MKNKAISKNKKNSLIHKKPLTKYYDILNM